MKLQLGFENIPYSARYSQQSPLTATMKARRPRQMSQPQQAYGTGKTVGQVAEELEKKYGVVETFYNLEENYIVDSFEGAYINGMELGMGGGSWDVIWDPSITLGSKFRRSLSSKRFDGLIRGVPTRASIKGVSHLRADPFKASSPRPSFIDTSLYQRSFKAWTEK
jgi:hypothetical protein